MSVLDHTSKSLTKILLAYLFVKQRENSELASNKFLAVTPEVLGDFTIMISRFDLFLMVFNR